MFLYQMIGQAQKGWKGACENWGDGRSLVFLMPQWRSRKISKASQAPTQDTEVECRDLGSRPRNQTLMCPQRGNHAISWQDINLGSRHSRGSQRTFQMAVHVEFFHDALLLKS